MVKVQGKGRDKQWIWSILITGEDEVTVELPRGLRKWNLAVEDTPGLPLPSNGSDPSWVDLFITRTRKPWQPHLLTLAWNVPGQKQVTILGSK